MIVYYKFVFHACLKKRRHDDKGVMESMTKILAAADKRAAEKKVSMWKFEMEREERRNESEHMQDEQMMNLLTRLRHQMTGCYMHRPSVQHVMTYPQPGNPSYFDTEKPGNNSFAGDN